MLLVKYIACLVVGSWMCGWYCCNYFSVSFSICILASVLIDTVKAPATASAVWLRKLFFCMSINGHGMYCKGCTKDILLPFNIKNCSVTVSSLQKHTHTLNISINVCVTNFCIMIIFKLNGDKVCRFWFGRDLKRVYFYLEVRHACHKFCNSVLWNKFILFI